MQKKMSKLVSIVTALALILTSFGGLGLFSVSAESAFDLQAVIDASDLTVTNDTTKDSLAESLKALTLPEGYTLGEVTDFYKVKAVGGAVETTAAEDVVLVEGEKGSIAAAVTVNGTAYTVTMPIEPEMEKYTFSTVSNTMDDWTGDNTNGYTYAGGYVDKLIIPDEITKLANDWHNWQSQKCVVYGKGITDVTRCAYFKAEVVVFKGAVTTINNLAFMNGENLKYIRLPDTVTSIGEEAFRNCKKLKYLYLPEGLTSISARVFCKPSEDGASNYNLEEIIIPSTVVKCGDDAFAGAANAEIIVLSKSDQWGWKPFYDNGADTSKVDYYKNITVRAFDGTRAYDTYYAYNAKQKLDDMTLTEAAARVAKAFYNKESSYETAEQINADKDNLLSEIQAAYFGVSAISAAFAGDWSDNGGSFENSVVLTKDEQSVSVKLVINNSVDFDEIINDGISVDNSTTADTVTARLEELKADGTIPASYTVSVTDFYKVKAQNGAIERGSTYPNASKDDTVLVEGKPGAVSFSLSVAAGASEISKTYTFKIEPEMKIYSFASISNTMDDWAKDDNGKYYYTGQAVAKLVIPDEITSDEIRSSYTPWHNWKAMTCIVYGKGITTVPKQTGMKAEVVVFKGEVTAIGEAAFHNATSLKYIRIPDTVKTINGHAFRNCSSLEYLYLPEGLETIGSNLFAVPSEGTPICYNIDEITIPSTVTECNGGAFAGAASKVLINVVSKSNDWSWEPFYDNNANHTYDDYYKNITIRVFNGGAAEKYYYSYNEKQFFANMTLTEATARAAAEAYAYADVYYESAAAAKADADNILNNIKAATLNPSKFDFAWVNTDFVQSLSAYENSLTVALGTSTNTITVGVKAEFDLAKAIKNADIKVDNNTTSDVYAEALKTAGIAPEGSEVIFEDYYKLNAFNGAIERGSTYEGASDKDIVLVEGERGYMAAVVTIKTASGLTATANVTYVIEPKYEIYSFSSVSNESEFTRDDSGNVTKYNGSAEKVIVPDDVVNLPNWWMGWKSGVKWIVYGKNLETINRQDAIYDLEGVTFTGDKLKTIGGQAFNGDTKLKYVKMPDSVTQTGDDLFRNCDAMEQVYFSSSLERINGKVFHDLTDSTKHNVTQITLPASLNYIAANAFAGAGKACEVTILSTQNNFWNRNVFYNAEYPEMGKNYTLQVYKTTAQATANTYFDTASGTKNYIEEMSAAQATVRAMYAADYNVSDYAENLASIETNQSKIMSSVTKGYFDAASISADWSDAWELSGSILSNTLKITDGKNSFEVPVSIASKSGYYAGTASILTSEDFAANANKQGLRMHFYFDSSSQDKILVDGNEYEIKDFGVLVKNIAYSLDAAEKISDELFVKGTAGVEVKSGKEGTISTLSGTDVHEYTAIVKNVPQGGIDYAFQYRGYITYATDSGDVTVYTDSMVASVANVFSSVSTNSDYSAMNDWFDGITLS